jgi:pyruvate dehydrogenase E2 component (dihydrolipoamide acetyltransferase)
MASEITVPKLSATMEEATLLKWHKAVGDTIREGDVLVELETDKAALEVEATASGILTEQKASEGDTVSVGAVIALLDGDSKPAEKITATPVASEAVAQAPRLEQVNAAAEGPQVASRAITGLGRPRPAQERKVMATPLARRLAMEADVKLQDLRGTGPRGRVTRKDVESHLSYLTKILPQSAISSKPPGQGEQARVDAGQGGTLRMRRAIAAQVSESRRTIPSFTLDRWVEFDMLEDARDLLNRRRDETERLTVTDLLIQAIADVLPEHAAIRSVWNSNTEQCDFREEITLGMVVATPNGLMIPVLSGIGKLGLEALSNLRRSAIEAVRTGRLGSQFSGRATLSLSNVGRLGVDRFEAIINPGETAILAIGRLAERPVARKGALAVARGANLTLSVDHRVIDGMVGGSFLGDLADRIERQTWRL